MSGLDLNGRVALVTGAARGIGLETARALHGRGASVALRKLVHAASKTGALQDRARALPVHGHR